MHLLAFALLAVAIVSGNEIKKICEPGTITKENCNDCRCSIDGTLRSCTRMECEPDERLRRETTDEDSKVGEINHQNSGLTSNGRLLLRQRRQVSHDRPCEAGKKFKIYCNTCACASDGFSVACTREICPEGMYNEDGSLKNIVETTNNGLIRQKRELSEGTTCEPGKTFKEYCNTCICGLDGVSMVCTMKACDESIYNKDGSLKNLGEVPNNPLLRQKRQVSHDRPCEAGKKFKIYCNTCACASDGFSVACTKVMCPEGMYNEDGSLKNVVETPRNGLIRQKRQVSHDRPCEAGKKFKIYCNTCACASDGFSVACTREICPEGMYNEDGSLKNVVETTNNGLIRQKRELSEGTTCEPGKTFKEYCNTCTCGLNGVSMVCTMKACDESIYNKDGSLKNLGEVPNNPLLRQKRQVSHDRPCEAGKKFKIYCNTCACASDGFSVACTREICPEGMYNEDGSLKNVVETPNNGLIRQKRQLSEGTTCEPGKTFKEYCNTCTCGLDGVSMVCTMKACDESIYNKDGSLKNLGEVPNNPLIRQKRQVSHDRPCEAGKKFKIYCNTCACASDGFSVACTREICPEGMYNEDGSLKNIVETPNNRLVRQKRQVSHDRPCEAGKKFKIYCNTCACASDGFSVACTREMCPEGMYNEDGSLKNVVKTPRNGLIRQKRQLSEGTTCEPGKTFKEYCNTCTCGLDGVSMVCTMKACDESIYNKDGSLKNLGEVPNNPLLRQKRQVSHDRPCEAGKKFKIYCNTCACASDGFSVACTREICPEGMYNEDGSLKNIVETPNNRLVRQKRQVSHDRPCEAGKKFKIYCNTCACASDGFSVACTREMCPEGMYNEDGSLKNVVETPRNGLIRQKRQLSEGTTCEPGKTFKEYCNTCTCGLDGVSMVCTMKACDESIYNKDGSLKNLGEVPNNPLLRQKRQVSHDRPCEAGKKFKIYCNTCACASDGFSVACTKEMCPEGMYNEDGSLKNVVETPRNGLIRQKRQLSEGTTCEPGKTFKEYCNTCTCGLDGVSMVCTMKACDESIYNKDGSLKNLGEVPNNPLLRQKRQVSHDRPCEAGKKFKIYCNTCACASDGFSVACTREICPEGMYNEDGSLKNVVETPNNGLIRQKRQLSEGTTCEPGKTFKEYCNTCTCGLDGVSMVCTMKACDESIYNKDGSLKNLGEVPNNPLIRQKRQVSHDRPCEAGKKFKIYCNTCACASDGFSVACTREICPEGMYNEDGSLKNIVETPNNRLVRQKRQVSHDRPCEAGKKFKIYCNTCACASDGFSVACTREICPEGMYNEDGSLKNVVETPRNGLIRQKRQLSKGTSCEPGKTFKEYCNTCTCGLDGVSMACTMIACDKRIYNKDGSLKNLGEVPNNPLLRQKRFLSNERRV